jgi:hypothetical protein
MADTSHLVVAMTTSKVATTSGIRIVTITTMISSHRAETERVSSNKRVALQVKLIVERTQHLAGRVSRIASMATGMLRVMRMEKMTSRI